VPGGAFADRIGPRRALIASWWVYAVAYLGFVVSPSPIVTWALFVLYAIHYGLGEGGEKALIVSLTPVGARGRAFGMLHAVSGFMLLPANICSASSRRSPVWRSPWARSRRRWRRWRSQLWWRRRISAAGSGRQSDHGVGARDRVQHARDRLDRSAAHPCGATGSLLAQLEHAAKARVDQQLRSGTGRVALGGRGSEIDQRSVRVAQR
jgi:hypothetical protein